MKNALLFLGALCCALIVAALAALSPVAFAVALPVLAGSGLLLNRRGRFFSAASSHAILGGVLCAGIVFSLFAPDVGGGVALAGVAGYAVRDGALKVTRALPNGAAAVTSTSIDLGHGTTGSHVTDTEFLIESPALTTAQLPDTKKITYDVVTSVNADLSSPTVVAAAVLVQTGAEGAGAAAAEQRFRLPSDCKRYVGIKATNDGTGNASGVSATLSMLF